MYQSTSQSTVGQHIGCYVCRGYRYMKIAHDLVTDQSGTGDADCWPIHH